MDLERVMPSEVSQTEKVWPPLHVEYEKQNTPNKQKVDAQRSSGQLPQGRGGQGTAQEAGTKRHRPPVTELYQPRHVTHHVGNTGSKLWWLCAGRAVTRRRVTSWHWQTLPPPRESKRYRNTGVRAYRHHIFLSIQLTSSLLWNSIVPFSSWNVTFWDIWRRHKNKGTFRS